MRRRTEPFSTWSLLAYNFHESLSLKPLFTYVRRHFDPPASEKQYVDRLEKVARDANQKQLLVLEEAGTSVEFTIDLNKPPGQPGVTISGARRIKRVFKTVVRVPIRRLYELEVRLRITTLPAEETVRILALPSVLMISQ